MRMARKLGPMTTKTARKGFYKGTRSGSMGSHTKYGGYVLDYKKVRHYVVPESLKDFKLTPFVTRKMEPTRGEFSGQPNGFFRTGEAYIQRWREEGSRI